MIRVSLYNMATHRLFKRFESIIIVAIGKRNSRPLILLFFTADYIAMECFWTELFNWPHISETFLFIQTERNYYIYILYFPSWIAALSINQFNAACIATWTCHTVGNNLCFSLSFYKQIIHRIVCNQCNIDCIT